MKITGQGLALSMLLAAWGLASAADRRPQSSESSSYRWVDEQGVTHYGDRVPPEATRKQRDVLNSQGVVVRHLEAEKTPKQLADEERQRTELARQQQHDQFLLTTYVSVQDIEALRDLRLEQLQSQIRGAELYIESLGARLGMLQERARNFLPYSERPEARRMPDDLAEELVRALNEVRSQRQTLEAKRGEQAALRAQFQSDIDRYRELKSPRAIMR